jgi:hypothetical protein
MLRKTLLLSSLLFCSTSNAAYYFDLNTDGRMTVSTDLKTVVLIRPAQQVFRAKLISANANQIDNDGRPYGLNVYEPENCDISKECNAPFLSVKNYTDKVGGFSLWLSDPNNKVIWSKNLSNTDFSSDPSQ